MNEKPGYYAIIPANVRYDRNLIPSARLLYGEITALCNEKGYCWASTEYFQNLYGVSRVSIQNWLKDLEDCGYIQRKVFYKEGTKEIDKRVITINNNPSKENLTRGSKENFTTPQRNLYNPSKENLTENITSNNTNNNSSSKENPYQLYQELFGVLNPINQENITKWIEDLNEELVIEAMKKAALDNKPYSYAEGILKQWDKHNIKTLEDVKARETSFANNYSQNKSNARNRLENSGSSEYDDLF
ncbi:Uncharacterized protein TEHN7126_1986 [Tetragenococcus halophilus subsp. halophilus]|uniref:DnaD domain protein n=1 Tax=Tetragenococcus halophilus TaxID=51669 RepID=UPI000CBBC59E|nr:DnaD domain protein [Tetragenococcus halophilus]GBD73867.1 Uncharacterized protein TEHN7125_2027 [Tetragenococcus halophilus subsp. halophilus]GBD76287.1 Uncharacterized protein TEHN7126_1986 [Tetragenococcus halophilus subsp. halophilus]